MNWEEQKVLIWGKTYPELSSRYYETVCTGGTLENGNFIRLYPIPFRYLQDNAIFTKYQWVSLKVLKAKDDPRPESYKVDLATIKILNSVPTDNYGWRSRKEIIFKNPAYQFDSVEKLLEENARKKTSMGLVFPKCIDDIEIEDRPKQEHEQFLQKLKDNRERAKQTELFGSFTVEEVKSLAFISKRFKIHWRCKNPNCNGHKMSILDWEAYELARKVGVQSAHSKLQDVLDMHKYDVGFFLGNFRLYPNTFAIGNIWRPKKTAHTQNLKLFETTP